MGAGSSAEVKEAFERNTTKKVAMKIIKKEIWPGEYSEPDDLLREVDIPLNLEDHPCITKILEVFDEKKLLAIVMEFAPGGELFDKVVEEYEEETLNEKTAKLRFYQISHAVAHLHRGNICHRDLKLENILLMNNSEDSLIKITDFGLSKHFSSVDVLETFVGTPVYMEPEIIATT